MSYVVLLDLVANILSGGHIPEPSTSFENDMCETRCEPSTSTVYINETEPSTSMTFEQCEHVLSCEPSTSTLGNAGNAGNEGIEPLT